MKWSWSLLIVLTFVVNCFAQSVADIARKERERQRVTKSRVVTGVGTLRPAPVTPAPGTAPTTTAQTAGTTTTPAKPSGATDNQGRDEQFWRTAFQKARDDAKRAEARVALLDLKVKDLNTQLMRQGDVYNRERRIGPEIAAAQKELDDARRDAEQATKTITDLEESLRKSGGPAGWAR